MNEWKKFAGTRPKIQELYGLYPLFAKSNIAEIVYYREIPIEYKYIFYIESTLPIQSRSYVIGKLLPRLLNLEFQFIVYVKSGQLSYSESAPIYQSWYISDSGPYSTRNQQLEIVSYPYIHEKDCILRTDIGFELDSFQNIIESSTGSTLLDL